MSPPADQERDPGTRTQAWSDRLWAGHWVDSGATGRRASEKKAGGGPWIGPGVGPGLGLGA